MQANIYIKKILGGQPNIQGNQSLTFSVKTPLGISCCLDASGVTLAAFSCLVRCVCASVCAVRACLYACVGICTSSHVLKFVCICVCMCMCVSEQSLFPSLAAPLGFPWCCRVDGLALLSVSGPAVCELARCWLRARPHVASLLSQLPLLPAKPAHTQKSQWGVRLTFKGPFIGAHRATCLLALSHLLPPLSRLKALECSDRLQLIFITQDCLADWNSFILWGGEMVWDPY